MIDTRNFLIEARPLQIKLGAGTGSIVIVRPHLHENKGAYQGFGYGFIVF